MWRIWMRNEALVNKCDRMLRFFEAQRTILIVTCDFDMYFCCLFGENGAYWKRNGQNELICIILITGDARIVYVFSILWRVSCILVH